MYCIAFKILHKNWIQFLGAFAKLRRETISFIISACSSARMSVCPHGTNWLTDFHGNFYFIIFRNSFEKIQV